MIYIFIFQIAWLKKTQVIKETSAKKKKNDFIRYIYIHIYVYISLWFYLKGNKTEENIKKASGHIKDVILGVF